MIPLFRANADLYETDDEVVAKFDLPGVKQGDIIVEIANDTLMVRVEKITEREESVENAFFMERSFSGFFRAVAVPPEADQDKVMADYEDGVLTVRFPIKAEYRGNRTRAGVGAPRAREQTEIPVSGAGPSGRGAMAMASPYQRRLGRDEMLRQGTDSPLYRSGSGTYYADTFERPSGDVAPEAYFGRGPEGRMSGLAMREAEVARREAAVARREMTQPYQPRLSRDEMMRQGSDSPLYPAGTGTYYSDTFERATGRTAPESSFGEKGGVSEGVMEKRQKPRGGKKVDVEGR